MIYIQKKEGVERIRKIVEKNHNLSDPEKGLDEKLDALYEHIEAGNDFSLICKIAKEVIKQLVCERIIDDRYREGTDKFNKLSEINKEIMRLAYRCMDPDQEIRPTCDKIIDKLMSISRGKLPPETCDEIEEYIASLDGITTQRYGTKEFIEKAVSKHFDVIDNSLKDVAKECLPDYTEPSETDEYEVFAILTQTNIIESV